MTLVLRTGAPAETEQIGAHLGALCYDGLVLALQGRLGAGKTLLTKGIARGLGVPNPQYVTSPTFTIHKIYKGRLELHHMDFYRLDESADPLELGIEEVLGCTGVCVIEWPDDFFDSLPPERLVVSIRHLEGDRRELTFTAETERAVGLCSELERLCMSYK